MNLELMLLLLNFVVQRADLNEIRSLLNRTVNKVCSFIKTGLPQYSNHLIDKSSSFYTFHFFVVLVNLMIILQKAQKRTVHTRFKG